MTEPVRVECERELGRWTIRVNGMFVVDFFLESTARRTAMKLQDALLMAGQTVDGHRT